MPEINISGRPPGSEPSGRPTYTGTVSDNEHRIPDFEVARKSIERLESKVDRLAREFDKATNAAASMARKVDAAASKKQAQEDRLFREKERGDRQIKAERDKQFRRETKDYERDRAEERRIKEKAVRQREKDDRAADALTRRQQMEAMERGRQEWALRRTASHIRNRAAWDVSPTAFRSLRHQGNIFQERVAAFQDRWGVQPFGVGDIARITGTGLGTMRGAYRVQNIARLGGLGQRAAEEKNWTELVRIEHELKRIERINADQLKFAKSPAEKAAVQRQEDAILRSRQRIFAGRSGHSGLTNAMGNVVGMIGAAATDPIVAGIMAGVGVAVAAVTEPITAAGIVKGITSGGQKYANFRISEARLGRIGGFSAAHLEKEILPNGIGAAASGGIVGQPAWMKALGMGPLDVVHNLEAFGVSAMYPKTVAGAIRMASLAPFITQSEGQLGKVLGIGTTLGFQTGGHTGDEASINKFFRQYAKAAAVGTEQGISNSQTFNTMVSLMSQRANSGATATGNMASLYDLYSRMVRSGAPGARNGNDIIGFQNDISKAEGGIGVGGDMGRNVVISEFFSRHGGFPKGPEAFRKQLGYSKEQWASMTSTPAARKMLQLAFAAAKNNIPLAYNYLGDFLKNDPSGAGFRRIYEGSGMPSPNTPTGAFAEARFLGTSLGRTVMYNSGYNAKPAAMVGLRGMPTLSQMTAINEAAHKYNVPVQALIALAQMESGMNNGAISQTGVRGLFQVTRGTGHDLGFSDAQLATTQGQADAAAKYWGILAHMSKVQAIRDPVLRRMVIAGMYAGGPGNVDKIIAAGQTGNYNYLNGIKNKGDVQRDMTLMAGQAYTNAGNMPIGALENGAQNQYAGLNESRYIFETLGSGLQAISNFSNTMDSATAALHRFIRELTDPHHKVNQGQGTYEAPGGFMSNGMFVPAAPRK